MKLPRVAVPTHLKCQCHLKCGSSSAAGSAEADYCGKPVYALEPGERTRLIEWEIPTIDDQQTTGRSHLIAGAAKASGWPLELSARFGVPFTPSTEWMPLAASAPCTLPSLVPVVRRYWD